MATESKVQHGVRMMLRQHMVHEVVDVLVGRVGKRTLWFGQSTTANKLAAAAEHLAAAQAILADLNE